MSDQIQYESLEAQGKQSSKSSRVLDNCLQRNYEEMVVNTSSFSRKKGKP